VTLTKETLDVRRIYDHLRHEIGFWEVGFAPVTATPGRPHAFDEAGFETVLGQFRDLANDYREAALAGRHHGFSNVRETLQEIHKGASKAWPCGAGFGLLGVSTAGDVNLCHRFAGSDAHKLGTVRDGIDREAQRGFLDAHHVASKTDCQTCWARPLCAGGCYHEAHTRYGSTNQPNLHYCEWIRGWTDTCLQSRAWRATPVPPQFEDSESTCPVTRRRRRSARGEDVLARAGAGRRGSKGAAPRPHIPLGCSTVFAPGWEVDRSGGTAGLCQPVERDLFDCHLGCFWPAQVPDQLNHAPDWTKKCAAAQKDWRKIDLIFP
jgi:radical SAM protein with 4Fe4S-binding SPASM domain